jgi:hypothetical protein
VLSIYDNDRGPGQANRAKLDARLERLNEFWGSRKLSEVTGDTCREYVRWRKSPGGARRDLEDLRSAINHHAKEGLHRGVVRVVLPSRGVPRTRWLTRNEAAVLLRVCWKGREIQTQHRGTHKGQKIETDKRPLRHLARFKLIGLYTGTRASAIATASLRKGEGRSFVDLQNGIFIGFPRDSVQRPSGSRPFQSPLACLRICAAGQQKASRRSTSSNGTEGPSNR